MLLLYSFRLVTRAIWPWPHPIHSPVCCAHKCDEGLLPGVCVSTVSGFWGIRGKNVNIFYVSIAEVSTKDNHIKAAGTDDDFRGPLCPICAAVLNTFRKKKKKGEDQWRLVFSHTAYIHLSLWCLFAAAAVNICAEV